MNLYNPYSASYEGLADARRQGSSQASAAQRPGVGLQSPRASGAPVAPSSPKTDRQTVRERDRQMDRETDRQTERQRDRQTDR